MKKHIIFFMADLPKQNQRFYLTWRNLYLLSIFLLSTATRLFAIEIPPAPAVILPIV